MRDGLLPISYDHAALNRRVLDTSALVAAQASTETLTAALVDLREELFDHFAREEEGLFPFVAELVPALADRVHEMATAHDTICGALSRTCHAAQTNADLLEALYERFEQAYAIHARSEADLLDGLSELLDAVQRDQLAQLIANL
ncbi:MAG: hemerythrin domain-containing protein [Kofleriaceae bacterium]